MIGPEVRAPDFTEAVVGYRVFALEKHTQHNYRLVSPHQRMPWPTVEMTAECTVVPKVPEGIVLPGPLKPHPAPAKDCGCGIYAYFNPCPVRTLSRDYFAYATHISRVTEVAALMTLSGRIEVHADGMRAQRARICALGSNANLSSHEHAALRVIADQFGVPLVPQSQLPAMASEYGRVLGKEHRPSLDEAADALASDPSFQAGVEAAMEYKPPRYITPRWLIALNGVCAAANAGLVIGLDDLYCVPALVLGAVVTGWLAGRRKEALR